MARLAFLIALPLVLVLPVAASAQRPTEVSTDGGEVALSYAFARGASLPFAATVALDMEALDSTPRRMRVDIAMPATFEVQSVSDAGQALVAASVRNVQVTATTGTRQTNLGDVASLLQSFRTSLTLSADGTVIERTGFQVRGTPRREDATIQIAFFDAISTVWPQFPTEPVAVGDSWLQVFPDASHDPDNDLSSTLTVRYTMAGFVDVGGRRQALVDVAVTRQIDGQVTDGAGRGSRVVGRGQGEGYIIFDYQRGRLSEQQISAGWVTTITETNGSRSQFAVRSDVSFRAQVFDAVVTTE